MSCRVLKRGVENISCDFLVRKTKEKGKKKIIGRYIPTEKNSMVENLYGSLGFVLLEKESNGTTTWMLDIDNYNFSEQPIDVKVV